MNFGPSHLDDILIYLLVRSLQLIYFSLAFFFLITFYKFVVKEILWDDDFFGIRNAFNRLRGIK